MMTIKDEVLVVLETRFEGRIAFYATARRDGIIYQAGIYSVSNDLKSEIQWISAWGSNPQKAMRNAARACRIDRQGDNLVVTVIGL